MSDDKLCPQIEPWAAGEHRIMSYQWDAPSDGSSRNPQITVVDRLMQSVSSQPASISYLRYRLYSCVVDRKNADLGCDLLQL
jgi:hypothetical protein